MLYILPRSPPSPPKRAPTSIRASARVWDGQDEGVLGGLCSGTKATGPSRKQKEAAQDETTKPQQLLPHTKQAGANFKQHFGQVVPIPGGNSISQVPKISSPPLPRRAQRWGHLRRTPPRSRKGVGRWERQPGRNNSNIPGGVPARKSTNLSFEPRVKGGLCAREHRVRFQSGLET